MPEQESSKKEKKSKKDDSAKKKSKSAGSKASSKSSKGKKSSKKSSASKGSSGKKKSGKKKSSSKKSKSSKKVLSAVRIRGTTGASPAVKTTLKNLKLYGKNNCVFVDNTKDMKGMLRKVKDFVTWGEVSESVKDDLKDREDDGVYRLHPPRGGLESKGLKKPYKNGGALGERDDMEELLAKMK